MLPESAAAGRPALQSPRSHAEKRRLLCPRCLQSFETAAGVAAGAEMLCPPCGERAEKKTGRPRDLPGPIARGAGAPAQAPGGRAPSGWLAGQIAAMAAWCTGRSVWPRLPLWIYFGWVGIRSWAQTDGYRSLFDGINLGIHELGHAIFQPLGRHLTAAGGTIAQCAAPLAAALVLRRQRDHFGVSVCICWMATNLWDVAIYLGDARALRLPLVAPGVGLMPPGEGAGMHDWNFLLGASGLLRWDTTISWALRLGSSACMAAGLGLGGWLLWKMLTARGESGSLPED